MFSGYHLSPPFIDSLFKKATNILSYFIFESIETIILRILAHNSFLIRFSYFHLHRDNISNDEAYGIIFQSIGQTHCLLSKSFAFNIVIFFSSCIILKHECRNTKFSGDTQEKAQQTFIATPLYCFTYTISSVKRQIPVPGVQKTVR